MRRGDVLVKTVRILIIAGSDSGGGAGIQADIKTVTMLGGHAMTAITAVTAQNTLGVMAIHSIPTDIVVAQIDAVVSDIGVDAVKIGMIGSAETAHAVADRLHTLGVPIVFDPVMIATSGAALADAETIAAFTRLMAMAALTTPNLPELEALGGEAALRGLTLIKGGHGEGTRLIDRLVDARGEIAHWDDDRIDTRDTHGTGCTLASAIATGLAQGLQIEAAIARARLFVRLALRDAPGLGRGHGPIGHAAVREDAMTIGPSLNQITVGARDYAASVAFYSTLGLVQIVDSPDNGYARFEAPNGVTLSIHAEGIVTSGTVVYFESQRLDAWVSELASLGLLFDQIPQDESWGWREARLLDPFGNVICLYSAGENRRYPPWRL
jgi:hydroxymethylpyrimidine/phosphomethylpyrimidine kinase